MPVFTGCRREAPMSNVHAITVQDVVKEYGGKQVLRIGSFAVPRGSITGIIGPSGAGKSTLLRILNILEPANTGKISYFGESASANGNTLELRRRMTMVFQKPALLDMSVYDNIAFGLRARHLDKKETDRRVQSVLDTIGMTDLSRHRAKTLSGGEAQRVAFARALVLRPEILFLDEPTANLDPANVELLESLITSLNRDEGSTVLIVTHNLFQARRLAHHTAFFCQGGLVETGETSQVFQNPQQEQTRAFVEGKMIY
jgi:tungstate transport system ATP-binding protein